MTLVFEGLVMSFWLLLVYVVGLGELVNTVGKANQNAI